MTIDNFFVGPRPKRLNPFSGPERLEIVPLLRPVSYPIALSYSLSVLDGFQELDVGLRQSVGSRAIPQ